MSRGTTHEGTGVQHGDYEIRQYEPGDFEPFCDLFDAVWSWRPDREWFEWRYASPYIDHVPITVAATEGELAGALPTIAYRLRSPTGTSLALQPADAMVHPDHRREGLLTRTTEAAIDRYRSGRPACFFNFPNAQILGAFLDLGWQEVGPVQTYYRIQNPSGLRESNFDDGVVGRLANAATSGYLRYRDWRATGNEHVSVERHETVPVDLLANLYQRAIPERIHAERGRAYYRWRFANPNWECRTYVASHEAPTAALVVYWLERHGTTYVRLMETAPLASPDLDSSAALLDAVIADFADADVLVAAEDTLQHAVLSSRGFHRDDRFPLSLAATDSRLVVRPLESGGSDWVSRATDCSDWLTTFGEQDGVY